MIKIYQINLDRDANRAAFMSSDRLKARNKKIDFASYDLVYEGNPGCVDLDDIFIKFNLAHPEDYRGRSLSVSDIVELIGNDAECGFYFCDSFDWKKLKMSFKFDEEV